MIESSARLKGWREQVAWMARLRMAHRPPMSGPVSVICHFTLPRPRSAPKSKRIFPDKKPDIDKLERAVLDALTAARVYGDDGQVTRLLGTKSYPGEDPYALEGPGLFCLVQPFRHGAVLPTIWHTGGDTP